MNAQHTPGRVCDVCEGFCLQPGRIDAGVDLSLRIGQRVRHRDHKGQRVTGVVNGLAIEDHVLQAHIVLDAPIVIPKTSIAADRDIQLWHQHVPAHELTPFDDRDDLVATLLEALRDARVLIGRERVIVAESSTNQHTGQIDDADDAAHLATLDRALLRVDAAIAKAVGAAA